MTEGTNGNNKTKLSIIKRSTSTTTRKKQEANNTV